MVVKAHLRTLTILIISLVQAAGLLSVQLTLDCKGALQGHPNMCASRSQVPRLHYLLQELKKAVNVPDGGVAAKSVLGSLVQETRECDQHKVAEFVRGQQSELVSKLRSHSDAGVRQRAASLAKEWDDISLLHAEAATTIRSGHAGLPSRAQPASMSTSTISSGNHQSQEVSRPDLARRAQHYQARVPQCWCPCCQDGRTGAALPLIPPFESSAVCEEIVEPTGLTTVGFRIWRDMQGDSHRARIGTMLAANSGRPGGMCGLRGKVGPIHGGYTTQEEDVFSNWMVTETAGDAARMDALFTATIDQQWGLVDTEGAGTNTWQGVDYRAAGASPRIFADAWTVCDCRLSHKTTAGPVYDSSRQYPTTLIFCAGPNAGAEPRGLSSSVRRTFCAAAASDYEWFRAGVKAALRMALYAMAAEGCDVALLARVSCGVYAGPHRARVNSEYARVVDEVLREGTLGRYFLRVVVTNLE